MLDSAALEVCSADSGAGRQSLRSLAEPQPKPKKPTYEIVGQQAPEGFLDSKAMMVTVC